MGRHLDVAVDTKHLPNRHLHIGQTGGLLNFCHGGGRHQSSGVSGAPETVICDMAADGCSMEPIREQRLAEARREIKVPLRNHLDRCLPRFLEGCPANHAMLSLLILEAGWKRGFAGTFHASSLPT